MKFRSSARTIAPEPGSGGWRFRWAGSAALAAMVFCGFANAKTVTKPGQCPGVNYQIVCTSSWKSSAPNGCANNGCSSTAALGWTFQSNRNPVWWFKPNRDYHNGTASTSTTSDPKYMSQNLMIRLSDPLSPGASFGSSPLGGWGHAGPGIFITNSKYDGCWIERADPPGGPLATVPETPAQQCSKEVPDVPSTPKPLDTTGSFCPAPSKGNPVDTSDGAWKKQLACLTLGGAGQQLAVSVRYDGNMAMRSHSTDSALPLGWTTDFTRKMDLSVPNVKTVVAENGSRYNFNQINSSTFVNQQSFDYTTLSMSNGNYVLSYRDGSTETYSGDNGFLRQRKDRQGNIIDIAYNGATGIRTITNMVTGQAILQKYALVGSVLRLVSIEDAPTNGGTIRKAELIYSSDGQKVIGFKDVSGRLHGFQYNSPVNPNLVTRYQNPEYSDSEAQGTDIAWDDSGRVTAQGLPNGVSVFFEWKPWTSSDYHLEVTYIGGQPNRTERLLFQTATMNGVTNTTGRVLKEYITDSAAQFTEYRYDARGNRTDVIDPAGRRTEFVYDANGFVTQQRVYKTATTYDTTSFSRNSFGQPTSITDPSGTQTTYNYNASTGLLTSMVRTGTTRNTSNTNVSTSQTTTIQYDNGTSGIVLAGSPTAVFPGLPTQITLPDGTLIKQQYDSLGHPTITTLDQGANKLNLTATSVHDWRGFLISSTDLRGIVTNYEYANNPAAGQYGNLGIASAMVKDVGGRNVRTEFTRDAMLNVTRQIDDVGGLNAETQIDWDMVGTKAEYSPIELRVKERMNGTTPVWRRQKIDYLPFGEIKTLEEVGALANGGNRTTTFAYTAQGWLDTIKTHDNRTVLDYTYSADLSGTIDSVSDARGVRTTFTWDPKGRLATITDGSANVVEAGFGGSNVTRSAINALTTLTYDNEDRVTKAEVIRNNGTTRTVYEHVYDQLDRLQRVKDGVGNEHDFYYDANRDWLIEQRLANNNAAHRQTTRLEYDAVGRMLRHLVDPSGLNLTTSYSYNESGVSDKWLLAKVINPRGKATQYRYDSLGALQSTIDPNGSTFEYSYNNLSHLVKMATLSPTGLEVNAASHYGVNLLGEVETLCRKAGAANLAACTGTGSMTESWQYKTDGMVKQMTDLSGQVIAYAYDDAGRLTSTNYGGTSGDPNGNRSDASYTYYPNDLLRTATSKPDGTNSETTQYEYDASNRLLNRIRGGRTVGYGYDKDDSLSSMDYWGRGSLGYARNGNGLVQTLSLWNNSASTSYAYRATNQLQSITRNNSNALNTTFGYDTAQRLIKLASAGNNGNFLTLANTRQVSGIETGNLDANGNPLSLVETIRGESGSKTTTYEYDDLDRLYIARMPEISTAIPGYSEITRYDASGNRIERTRTYADSNRKRFNHGDLNRDGTADISWTQFSSGTQAHWYMGGSNSETIGSGVVLTGIPAGWIMEARADFNHDGVIDALARSRSPIDRTEIWIMGGANSEKLLARIPLTSPGASWYVHATGDFNRDGSIDLVWRNYSTGDNFIWYMTGADGATYVSSSALFNAGPSWRLSGAGDFDQDGTPDLVWLDGSWAGGSGMFAIWKMGGADGSSFVSGQGFQQGLVGWIIDGVADVDNDGDPDIQWHNYQSGHRVNWIMNGFAIQSNSTIFTDAPTPLDWVAHATGQERLSAQSQFMTYSPLDLNTNGGVLSNANQSLSQSSDGQTYAYDAAERLMKTSQTDGSSIEYQYDALGNLVRSKQIKAGTTTTSEYVIDEGVALPVLLGEIASSTTGSSTTIKETHYAFGGEGLHAQRSCEVVSGALQNCALHYALLDRLGSVRMLTDGSNITSTTHFDAWGQIRSQNGTAKSGLAFTGEQQFADGTVYLRARHYMPSQGRFLQRDSFAGFLDRPQSLNRFAYVEGMPTNAVDPSGHCVFGLWCPWGNKPAPTPSPTQSPTAAPSAPPAGNSYPPTIPPGHGTHECIKIKANGGLGGSLTADVLGKLGKAGITVNTSGGGEIEYCKPVFPPQLPKPTVQTPPVDIGGSCLAGVDGYGLFVACPSRSHPGIMIKNRPDSDDRQCLKNGKVISCPKGCY